METITRPNDTKIPIKVAISNRKLLLMHRQKTGHGSGAGTVSRKPNARGYPEYGNYRLVMKASIVPQDGSRKSQKSPVFAAGGEVELYEIKWENSGTQFSVRIRIGCWCSRFGAGRQPFVTQASILAGVSQLFDDKIKASYWRVSWF
jgi:hypothetical protein